MKINLPLKKYPRNYLITGSYYNIDDFKNKFEIVLQKDYEFIQLRSKNISTSDYIELAKIALRLVEKTKSKLILNTTPEVADILNHHGIHLTSDLLMSLKSRPMNKKKIVSAACHNEEQLNQAVKIDVDIVTLSPVLFTKTHPEAEPLGWYKFKALAQNYPLPVFALGGMQNVDVNHARSNGAHGIASISWW